MQLLRPGSQLTECNGVMKGCWANGPFRMSAIAWIIVGTTVGIVSPLFYFRVKKRPRGRAANRPVMRRRSPPEAPGTSNPYHAVSIVPCLDACQAVRRIQGERFLSAEAPSLPVAGCDQPNCQCHYLHHDDRRTGLDRRNTFAKFSGFMHRSGAKERRRENDRRSS